MLMPRCWWVWVRCVSMDWKIIPDREAVNTYLEKKSRMIYRMVSGSESVRAGRHEKARRLAGQGCSNGR